VLVLGLHGADLAVSGGAWTGGAAGVAVADRRGRSHRRWCGRPLRCEWDEADKAGMQQAGARGGVAHANSREA
jgi:hypothetical protein